MTIREALRAGAQRLSPRGDAFLASEVLLAFLLGRSREYIFAHPEDFFSDDLFQRYLFFLKEVLNAKPLAHITHLKEFFGLNFYVDERVLIPRPETEHLVEEVLNFCVKADSLTIADVGTGSGCIAIALAQHLPHANFYSLDVSRDALEVATKNVHQYGLQDRIKIMYSDLLDIIIDQKIDVIVANLPYVGEKEFRFVDKDVELYEPKIALFGGGDGLQLYKKMFQQIASMKFQPKLIVGEFGFGQGETLRVLLNQFFEYKWKIAKDYADIERIFIVHA